MDSKIHLVSSLESPEFTLLTESLTQSPLVGLDAEWKPIRTHQSSFPNVSLLQLACQLGLHSANSLVFLLDLSTIPLSSIYELLKDVFVSPDVLKLGFRFKQDLIYLSSTFSSQGCDPGFDRVEPYLDITSIYNYLQHKSLGRRIPKVTKSLASICKELLNISLSKELQCSDWSLRPLTEEQKTYAATDAHCLLEIFNIFHSKVVEKGDSFYSSPEQRFSNVGSGLTDTCSTPHRSEYFDAVDIVPGTTSELAQRKAALDDVVTWSSCRNTIREDESLINIVRKYGEMILLKESDRKPKTSKKKGKKQSSSVCKEKQIEISDDWCGPPPWDLSLGGDGCPKFLCDVMVEGLAKHLRCVGIDAAIPFSKKPESRDLIDQAQKDNRVLLTRDSKLLRHGYLINNQIYRVKSLLKNEQLLEVIKTFHLEICEDQLMSRCTKCNGRFIQKPLTAKEASKAAEGFQVIPNCLFNKNLEFWQCMNCNQVYWEVNDTGNIVDSDVPTTSFSHSKRRLD